MIIFPRKKIALIAILAVSLSIGSYALSDDLNQEPGTVSTFTYATHSNSKFTATINNRGWIGPSYRTSNFGWDSYGFEFPRHSKIDYLEVGGIWVGGIVGTDTLVSVSAFHEYLFPPHDPLSYAEFFPLALLSGNLIDTLAHESATIYSTRYCDTIRGDTAGLYLDSRTQRLHQPLGLEIHQRSYSTDLPLYRNILILDYTVTNIGNNQIESAYVGFMLDGGATPADAHNFSGGRNYIGSLASDSIIYLIDNDGIHDSPTPELIRDALGLKCLRSYPPAENVNFNWWHSFPDPDYGPRLKPTENDPYFYFGSGRTGMPNGDAVRYYLLSHPEWDYDQIFIKEKTLNDSSWFEADRIASDSSILGRDVTGLLSIGPLDLTPGNSARILFALFGGELVHITEDNYQNILDGQYHRFFENLQMGLLAENGTHATTMGTDIVSPKSAPTGLKLNWCSGNSAKIAWDPWVFDDINGYTIHIRPAQPNEMISPRFLIPADDYDMNNTLTLDVEKNQQSFQIDNLVQGELYLVSLSHQFAGSNGNISNPILIGDQNDQLTGPPIQIKRNYLDYSPDNRSVRISWDKPDGDVKYYKIYKTNDSVVAFNRYHSLLSDRVMPSYFELKSCWDFDQRSFCYYEMTGYDSISSSRLEYVDQTIPGLAWYWVSAVYSEGFESEFSPLIKSCPATLPDKDVLVVMGTTNSLYDYVLQDSLISFYEQALGAFNYDIYNWTDSVLTNQDCLLQTCLNWSDFAAYKTIIFNEYQSGMILRPGSELVENLMARLVDGGRTVIYFGLPSTQKIINLSYNHEKLTYPDSSFENNYFGILNSYVRSWEKSYSSLGAIDSLAGFNSALPVTTDWPQLDYDNVNDRTSVFFKYLFDIEYALPYVPAFTTSNEVEPLYQFGSEYSSTSELQGMTCGLLNHRESGDLYLFSFPLWAIKPEQAGELIATILDRSPFKPAEHSPTTIPNDFELSQNFPNPFNISTVISFDLTRSSEVSLQIFNGLGQEVRTLLNNKLLTVGKHEIKWNGINNQGSVVASGVYLYRFQSNGSEASRKMVLIK